MSDCVETHANLPFELSVPSDLIDSVECIPFPSGFLTASKCDVAFLKNSIIVDRLVLTFWTGIRLTEIEVYGFPDYQCFNLANTTTGKNSFDNDLNVDMLFVYDNIYYSNPDDLIANFALNFFDIKDVIILNIQLYSPNCLNSYLPWTISLVPQSPASINCSDVVQMINDRSIKSDCACRDLIGFPTYCFSLSSSGVVINSKYPQISLHFNYCLEQHCWFTVGNSSISPGIFTFQLTLPRTNSTSYLNITLIQGQLTMIDISTDDYAYCTPIIRYRSCLLLNISVLITEVDLFFNETYSVSALELNFPSTNDFTFITLNEFQLQVLFFPLHTPQQFFVSYSSLSSSINLPLASCPFRFIVKNSVCDCPAGFFFDFGNCTACPLNSYRSTSHSSCLDCPVNRVTLNNSSTSLSDCLCRKDLFQVNGNCVGCPSGTDCYYGSIIRSRT
ncbi:hypothetical protein GEMRC1_012035 [Eukaryota sp. GEM-RC1]